MGGDGTGGEEKGGERKGGRGREGKGRGGGRGRGEESPLPQIPGFVPGSRSDQITGC